MHNGVLMYQVFMTLLCNDFIVSLLCTICTDSIIVQNNFQI